MKKNPKQLVEDFIFSSRWWLIIPYAVLYMALLVYIYYDILWFFDKVTGDKSSNEAMLFIVEGMDIVMIASLAKMVITGSYNSFVSKEHFSKEDNVSSGLLKVKMASSLVGISSIHLLKDFVDIKDVEWETLSKLLAIHFAFIIGVIALAWIYAVYTKTEKIEHEMDHDDADVNSMHSATHKDSSQTSLQG